ncbi:hypothetical protein A2U01_0117527, partial [Trifolium medium]|nr:hypothetical protein [Trifolium medium]
MPKRKQLKRRALHPLCLRGLLLIGLLPLLPSRSSTRSDLERRIWAKPIPLGRVG